MRLWVTHWSSESEIWETEQAWVRLIHQVSPTETLTHQVRHSLPWSDTMFPHCTHTVRHSVYQAFTQALMHSVRHLLTESLIHQSYTPIHPVRHSVIQSLTHSHSVRDTHSWSPPDAYYTGRHSLTHWDIHSPPPPPPIRSLTHPVIYLLTQWDTQSDTNSFRHTVRHTHPVRQSLRCSLSQILGHTFLDSLADLITHIFTDALSQLLLHL